jgi:flagellar hook assembly protein FlgD
VVLHQNRPNPFNPVTVIPYELSAAGAVSLRIYSVQGRLVRSLFDGHVHAAGRHAARWDGRDARGRPVGSGVYFYRMEAEGKIATRSMIVVR